MGRHHPPQFTVDIACEFHGAGLSEMHTIRRTQPTNLAFEVRALHRVTSLLVDEAVPDIDVNDSGFFGARAIKLVEITHVAGRFWAADGRQSDPHDRHAFALERRDHVVDAFGVDRRPWVGMKFIGAAAGRRPLRVALGSPLAAPLRYRRVPSCLAAVGTRPGWPPGSHFAPARRRVWRSAAADSCRAAPRDRSGPASPRSRPASRSPAHL